MSKITERIFKRKEHYVTSKFGPRTPIKTKYGTTSSFHKGTDYGTNGKKTEQYAVEKGTVLSTGTSNSCGKYVWINYPRLNVKMCHYHLDSICVKKGQAVDNDTLVGYTGTTGMSTGIHLHLGVYDLINGEYIDPEVFAENYAEPTVEEAENTAEYLFNPTDVVVLNENSTEYQHASKGVKIPDSVKNKEYTVKQIDNNGCILLEEINSWVLAKECTLSKEEYFNYVIKKGDNLWNLAQKYNTSVDELAELNNIKDVDLIIEGSTLKIPR